MAVRPKVYSLFQRQGNSWVRIHDGFWGKRKAEQMFGFFLKKDKSLAIKRAVKDQPIRMANL